MTRWELATLGEPEFSARQILASLYEKLKFTVELDPRHKIRDRGQDGLRNEPVEHQPRQQLEQRPGRREVQLELGRELEQRPVLNNGTYWFDAGFIPVTNVSNNREYTGNWNFTAYGHSCSGQTSTWNFSYGGASGSNNHPYSHCN
ncbi:hypothetical protein ABR738_36225 [Streptomyces sp. Edi4]|uniref:hypothetical protein n=1 Tax=Streptomyces sp. Edi4 TaxID=3162527 RepID=UPI003305994A